MEQKNHGSPSFINITVLLLFAIVIAVASTVTTYFFLSSRTVEQPAVTQPPIVLPTQTNMYPTTPPTTQTTVPTDETANWKVYRNEKYKYELKYPPNWNFKDYYNPDDHTEHKSSFRDSLSFQNNTEIVTVSIISDYLDEATFGFERGERTGSIAQSQKNILISGNIPAQKYERQMNINPNLREIGVYFQFIGRVYELYFTEQMQNDIKNRMIFDQILSTFKFTN